jgi:hypothetical protein
LESKAYLGDSLKDRLKMKWLPEQFRVLMGMLVLTLPGYKINAIRKSYSSKPEHYYTQTQIPSFSSLYTGLKIRCALKLQPGLL